MATQDEDLAAAINGFYGTYGTQLAQPNPNVVAPSPALASSINGFYGDLSNQAVAQQQQNALTAQSNATNAKYGTDLSWLDPSFNTTPAYVGQSAGSQVYANPQDVAAQQSVYNQTGSYVGKDMGYASPAQQQTQYNNWGNVAAGQGAPTFMGNGQQQGLVNDISSLSGPQWASADQQQGILDQIQNLQGPKFGTDQKQQDVYNQTQAIKDPTFGTDTDQRAVMNNLGAVAASGGSQGLNFDDGSRQAEQYGNMKEIIDNGGLTATERSKRAQARADEEQWIRGQREADQQQLDQRGMGGSGQQVLSLGQDRQAAAGRISLADQAAAADAEQRRLSTIGMASDAATAMRGQTFNEQSYMGTRGDNALVAQGNMANALRQDAYQEGMGTTNTQLQRAAQAGTMANQLRQAAYQEGTATAQFGLSQAGLAGDMANQLRQDQYNEQAYQTGYELNKVVDQANIVGQMRSQDFSELSYNDQRALEGMRQQTNLANQLRSDQFQESNATRGYDLQALANQGTMATNMRNASSQEAQSRAASTDHFTELNQSAYNNAELANKNFMQDSYNQMMSNRQNWEMQNKALGVGVATSTQNYDASQNSDAYNAMQAQAQANANRYNTAQANANNTKTATALGGNTMVLGATQNANDAFGQVVGGSTGAYTDFLAQAAGAPSTGGASSIPQQSNNSPGVINGTPTSPSGTGGTWASGGGAQIGGTSAALTDAQGQQKDRFVY